MSGIIGREPIIKSKHDEGEGDDNDPKKTRMHVFNPHDIVGRSFLMNKRIDGQRHCLG